MKAIVYHKIFPLDSSLSVCKEVLETLNGVYAGIDPKLVRHVFRWVEGLYRGNHPGFQACNTGYHDFRHAIGTALAMSRLMHGAAADGTMVSEKYIYLGMVSAILHDVGYIQEASDLKGTGAKYTANHEERSMDFLSRYGDGLSLTARDIALGRTLIFCTNLDVDITAVQFPSDQIELLARMLSAADLTAQLSDQRYVAKLPLLYRERTEAGLASDLSELDFLRISLEFYDIFEHHLKSRLRKSDKYMRLHFASKWHINKNLYRQMIDEQKKNLLKIIRATVHPAED